MSLRNEHLGLLRTKEMEARVLLVKFKGLREQLHRGTNPYWDRAEYKGDEMELAAVEANKAARELAALERQIAALCQETGEPVPQFK